jgi:NAD(P)-dependent dehydrogenase (short-subunit alcohol dehydrogenase family)
MVASKIASSVNADRAWRGVLLGFSVRAALEANGARDDDRGRAAVALSIRNEHGRLDILVNNAGIFDPTDGPPGKASMSAVRRVFETNFFGALAVTQAMLPLFFVKTDLTGYGTMTPAEGAKLPVQHALAGEDNGVFVEPGGSTPW